jgi:hypothetical protein
MIRREKVIVAPCHRFALRTFHGFEPPMQRSAAAASTPSGAPPMPK